MKSQELQQTFENCAAFSIDIDKHPECRGSRTAVEQEAQYHLCHAIADLLADYDMGKHVKIAFDLENTSMEENIIRIVRDETDKIPLRSYETLRRGADLLLSNLARRIGKEHDIGISGERENVLGEIRYNAYDLHDVLWSLVTQEHPSNSDAMSHLNTLTHLVGRLNKYVPAYNLN